MSRQRVAPVTTNRTNGNGSQERLDSWSADLWAKADACAEEYRRGKTVGSIANKFAMNEDYVCACILMVRKYPATRPRQDALAAFDEVKPSRSKEGD